MRIKYLTRQDIARRTKRKREWIRIFLKGMRESGRYPPDDIIDDGYLTLVAEPAFWDWLKYRHMIQNGELVPPYERRQLWIPSKNLDITSLRSKRSSKANQ